MAIGDTVSYGDDAVASAGNTDLQPGAGVEVMIHSIEVQAGKSLDVKRTNDGTNFTTLFSLDAGGVVNVNLKVTNNYWLRLTNTSGGNAGNYAAGVQTK